MKSVAGGLVASHPGRGGCCTCADSPGEVLLCQDHQPPAFGRKEESIRNASTAINNDQFRVQWLRIAAKGNEKHTAS